MQLPTVPPRLALFFRSTRRYGKLGTISRNTGYLSVDRCGKTGRFVAKKSA